MSWHKDEDRQPRRGYHHGNLREALIRAALELIGKKGPAGFTFAEAARAAGVSSAAPYRHYRDLPELMADVALMGFEKFEAGLSKAWNNGTPEPVAAFENVGKAYLAFAREEPALYAAMFESGLALDAVPALQQASDRAFAVLRAASEAVAAQIPKEGRPPALMLSLHMWAFAHGIASLFARGDAARRKLPMSADDLLEAGFLIYLQGLGSPPKR
jgi:AcrR family transcriptional regulator